MAKRKIKDMLREAEEAVKNASPEGDAKAIAEARVAFLKEMQSEGFTVNQDHINDVVAAETQRVNGEWETVVGSGLDDTKEFMASLSDEDLENLASDSTDTGGGEDDTDSETNVLKLMRQGLSERDARIEKLDSSLGSFRSRYAEERVNNALNEMFRREGLDERFLPAARRLADYSDLIEKSASGQEVSDEELESKVSSVKELSGVWFGEGGTLQTDPRALPGGFRLKPEAVLGIPPTPSARSTAEITDADREARASNAY